jgi:hypothetical protein
MCNDGGCTYKPKHSTFALQFGLAGVEDCFVSYLTQGFISEKSFNLWLLDVK